MSRYYCPFCSTSYQYYKNRSDGLMICGQCGEELFKAPFIKMSRFLGAIGAISFIVPMLLMFSFLVKELLNQRINNSSDQIDFLSLNIDDRKY